MDCSVQALSSIHLQEVLLVFREVRNSFSDDSFDFCRGSPRSRQFWNWSVIGIIEPGVAEMNLPSTATQLNYMAENSFEEVWFRYLFTRE
jgi:hypothetical protein